MLSTVGYFSKCNLKNPGLRSQGKWSHDWTISFLTFSKFSTLILMQVFVD